MPERMQIRRKLLVNGKRRGSRPKLSLITERICLRKVRS